MKDTFIYNDYPADFVEKHIERMAERMWRERVEERERKNCVVKCEDMKMMNENEDEHCAEPMEQKRNEDEGEELLCWMQYVPGLFENLKKRLWREAKVRLRFSKNPTIGNMLSKVKRRTAMLEKRGVVYGLILLGRFQQAQRRQLGVPLYVTVIITTSTHYTIITMTIIVLVHPCTFVLITMYGFEQTHADGTRTFTLTSPSRTPPHNRHSH